MYALVLKHDMIFTVRSCIRCISGVLKNKPRILVTHQLQYLKAADQILVLKEVSPHVPKLYSMHSIYLLIKEMHQYTFVLPSNTLGLLQEPLI